jgi:hypothetical protein
MQEVLKSICEGALTAARPDIANRAYLSFFAVIVCETLQAMRKVNPRLATNTYLVIRGGRPPASITASLCLSLWPWYDAADTHYFACR